MRKARTPSFTVAIGSALAFLSLAAATSFLAEDQATAKQTQTQTAGQPIGHGWTLRGSLIPSAEARTTR